MVVPNNVGIPTTVKPHKCWFCATPIWRWRVDKWVCYNCKYHSIVYEHQDGELENLEECHPTGYYKERVKIW